MSRLISTPISRRGRRRLDVERGRPGHAPRLEIGVEIKRDMGHPGDLRPGVGVHVPGIGPGQDRRDRALAAALRGRADGGGEEQGDGKDEETHRGLT